MIKEKIKNYKRTSHSFYTKPIPQLHKDYLEGIEALKKTAAKAEKLEARVKELEAELSKLKRSYDIMSAYAVHYVPEHKTQELIKDVNKAYE